MIYAIFCTLKQWVTFLLCNAKIQIFRHIHSSLHVALTLQIRPQWRGTHSSTNRYPFQNEEVSLRIQSKCRKIQTRKTPNADTFNAVDPFEKIYFSAKWKKVDKTFSKDSRGYRNTVFKRYRNGTLGQNALRILFLVLWMQEWLFAY